MGVAATPKVGESGYYTLKERKELEISDQKCSNHHALYVGYNATNVFHSAIKVATRVRVCFQRIFYHFIP